MKLFLDTANLEEIEKSYASGVTEGITTNPSLLKKAIDELKKKKKKFDMISYITEILLVAKGTPVSLEVASTDAEDMIEEGKELYNKFNPIANNVVIKIPINTSLTGKNKNFEGLKAIKSLAQARIPVNCTLIFTPEQALMAAKSGASYVSPFAGRIDDALRDQCGIVHERSDYFPAEGFHHQGKLVNDNGIVSGVDLVAKCVNIMKTHGLKTQVLAASIRNSRQLREVALAGAHIATLPFEVLQQALVHSKTIEGIKQFTDDMPSEYTKIAQGKK